MLKPNAVPHIKIVAGNKCDLANSRAVSSAEGLEWARNHDCGFMETSARNVVNIEETFECKCNCGGAKALLRGRFVSLGMRKRVPRGLCGFTDSLRLASPGI